MAASKSIAKNASKEVRQRRYFTVAEANRALPLVRRIAADVQHVELERRDLVELSHSLDANSIEIREVERQFDKLTHRLFDYMEELNLIGVELKAPTRGLLDFPAVLDGRDILLCWELGEDAIDHWHETHTGYAGRRPVGELVRRTSRRTSR